MPTALFTRARTAGLVALTLMIAASGAAAPAQASSLKHSFDIAIGSGSDKNSHRDDCDSRREIKYYFTDKYDLKHVDVSKTHDYYIYKVSGLIAAKATMLREEALDTGKKLKTKDHDYVRYLVLYDACEHKILEQILPRSMQAIVQ